jgi:NADH:ubiquinone oxidoreductase subunit 6 (subunit J)
MTYALVVIGIWVFLVYGIGQFAESKGRRRWPWMFFAALLSPILAFIGLVIAGTSIEGRMHQETQVQKRIRSATPISVGQIKELGDLRDAGLITAEEFEAKKADLLNRV